VKILSCHFECDTHHLGRLIKLHQTGTIMEYITGFELLHIHIEGQSNLFLKECFIGGLKDEIKAHVMMQIPQNGWKIVTEPKNMR
jgi:hypothetical protein